MRRIYFFSALTSLLAALAFSQPKLSLDKPEVDLGTIYGGVKKIGTITLKNIGNDTLRIISVQPTCGCTAVKQPKAFLLPGESDIAEFEFNSAGYRGKVEKHVNINTNDPTSRYVDVKILAEIKEILQPTNGTINGTSTLWFNNAIVGKMTTQTVGLKNISGIPIVVKGDSVSSSALALKINNQTLRPDDTLSVQVTLQPQKTGSAYEHFYILTNHKNQPVVEIQVKYFGIKEN
jgi:hypothetical protein